MGFSTNSMVHIFGAGDKKADEINIVKNLSAGVLDGRKAVSYLLNQIDAGSEVKVELEEGALKWKVGDTVVDFTQDANATSFGSRLIHRIMMAVSSKYEAEFYNKIDKVVIAYSKFENARYKPLFDQAVAANEAQIIAAAAEAQAELAAAAAKATQIANLNTQITEKNGALTTCQNTKDALATEKTALQAEIANLTATHNSELTSMSKFKNQYNALAKVHEKNVAFYWNDEETALAQKAADLIEVSIDDVKKKAYREVNLPVLFAAYNTSKAKVEGYDSDIITKNTAMDNLNNAINNNNAAVETINTEIANLTLALLVLEPAPAVVVPLVADPAPIVEEPLIPEVIEEIVLDESLDLVGESYLKAFSRGLNHHSATFYSYLPVEQQVVYDTILSIGGKTSAPLANFLFSLCNKRFQSFEATGNTLSINVNPGQGTLNIDDVVIALKLPENITGVFDETSKKWKIQGDIQVTKAGVTFSLNNAEILYKNGGVFVDVKNAPWGTDWIVDKFREGEGKAGLHPSMLLLGLECVDWKE